MKVFGRRKPKLEYVDGYLPSQHPQHTDGLTRVWPEEFWQGEIGEMLREAGFHPNMPGNILDNGEPPTQLLQNERMAFQQRLLAINAELPAKVRPVQMLPEALWLTQHGWFLIRQLHLYPFAPWNTLLLPADGIGARLTGLPVCPVHLDQEVDDKSLVAVQAIRQLYTRQGDDLDEIAVKILDATAGKVPDMMPFDQAEMPIELKAARRRMRALAFLKGCDIAGMDALIASRRTYLSDPAVELTS
ncbi:MAG: hypothetical protein AAF441_25460 [Pseudomonadota bacterium]